MRNWRKDKRRAAKLLGLLQDDATDSFSKERIRVWFWNKVSVKEKEIAVEDQFRSMKQNLTPDAYDYQKYDELAESLNISKASIIRLSKRKSRSLLQLSMKIAAAVILILSIPGVVYLWINEARDATEQHVIAEVTAAIGETKKVVLPDGSTVTLEQNAKIKYDSQFMDGRNVELSGSALFSVVKSLDGDGDTLPFTVTTDKITVNVLGTVFRVFDHADIDESTVSLYQGSVSVEVDENVTTLKYGEALSFSGETRKSKISLIPAEEMINLGFMPLLRFEMSTLGNLITSLEANYDIKFVIPQGVDISKGAFSGDFRNETLDSTLRILNKSNMNYTFTQVEDKVFITKTNKIK